jgi:predicted outer membrane repeat protein
VTNCTISANTASVQGGGLYALGASPTIRNSTIGANLGSGGIYADQSLPAADQLHRRGQHGR